MKTKIITSMLGIGMLISSSAFAANGTVTGITLSKTAIQAGETITFSVQGNIAAGKKCHLYGLRGDTGESYDLGLVSAASASATTFSASFPANGFPAKPLTLTKQGQQYIHASGGTADKENECTGSVSAIVTVGGVTKPPSAPSASPAAGSVNQSSTMAAATASCPDGYRTDLNTPATGELKCTKLQLSCPSGFTSSMDSKTGFLTCTPIVEGKCPDGWVGAVEKGLLLCAPVKRHVDCVKTAPDWKWGDEYYTESWNVVGCYKKPKIVN